MLSPPGSELDMNSNFCNVIRGKDRLVRIVSLRWAGSQAYVEK